MTTTFDLFLPHLDVLDRRVERVSAGSVGVHIDHVIHNRHHLRIIRDILKAE